MINLLFVHPPVGNALELFKAFKKNSNFNSELLSEKKGKDDTFLDKFKFKMKIPTDFYNYNRILRNKNLDCFDILFIVKGTMIKARTLKIIRNKYPKLKLVSWTLDDMYAWHNRSIYYTLGLKYYNLVITNKSYNVIELKKIGAKKFFFHNNLYSKNIHYPIFKKKSKYAHDVLFIGTLEKERFESMFFLAENGIKVNVYSDSFKDKNFKKYHKNLIIHKGGLYGENHAEAISNSKITLCFLRKINRDLQTTRSVEIPACGGCMLAERTEEHLQLFEEDKEALFFNDNLELLDKVNRLLENKFLRKNIVSNALIRCETSGYSYDDLTVKLEYQFLKLLEKNESINFSKR